MVDVNQHNSLIDDAERRADHHRTPPVKRLTALAVIASILVFPALYRPTLTGKLRFDPTVRNEIERERPAYVFIGNSMLGTRIDPGTLEGRLGRGCCYVLWTGGAESAWDHQALKNAVLATTHKPKTVFIFFRDTYLTRVTYRTDDQYWWKIERLSGEDEPELMEAMRSSRSWQETLAFDFGRVYPLQKRRDNVSYAFQWLATTVAFPGHPPFGPPLDGRVNSLFSLDRLKNIDTADDAGGPADPSVYDFDAHIATSLLPSMLALAHRAHVNLVFVRVQRRPTPSGPPPQSTELQHYIGKLRTYLERNGAALYDFTGDPALTLDHYMDGDHIKADWRRQSTELFLTRLARYFR